MTASRFAKKGSQRWLQVVVERNPEILNAPLRASMKLAEGVGIEWLSPVRSENFVEYCDGLAFQNDRWHLPLKAQSLAEFWPQRGPKWDGLARTSDGQFLIVEAKAHIPEIVPPRSRATEPARGRIRASMRAAQASLAPNSTGVVDWAGTFYQYANRVAYLHFLRETNKEKAHLVNIYFYNAPDVASPPARAQWEGAIQVVECYLGLGRHRMAKFMHKIFVDTATVTSLCSAEE